VTWTSSSDSERVGSLLREGTDALRQSGSESPRLDAELLLGHALGVDRATLIAAPEAAVGQGQATVYREAIGRRATGEPVAYIRGIKEFYGLALAVDPRALIPRPETELLVELGMDRLRRMLTERPRPASGEPLLVWDVATGSGAVAVAMAVESRRRGYGRDARFRATDVSGDALSVATENAVAHGVADMIEFATADLTDLPDSRPADLLLANLPYIPSATLRTLPVAASFEPASALDGGPDGLDLVRRLLDQLPHALANEGTALLEIGASQADDVRAEASDRLPDWQSAVHPDLAGLPRVVELIRGAAT
jgi:release factor glutamine methyltransferase